MIEFVDGWTPSTAALVPGSQRSMLFVWPGRGFQSESWKVMKRRETESLLRRLRTHHLHAHFQSSRLEPGVSQKYPPVGLANGKISEFGISKFLGQWSIV